MKPSVLLNFALSIVAAGAMALAGFSLRETYAANREIGVLQEKLVALSQTKDRDTAQDRSIALQWSYLRWAHDQINAVRTNPNVGMGLATSPTFRE